MIRLILTARALRAFADGFVAVCCRLTCSR